MAACIQMKKLTKCYGSTVAVSGLSLEVESGEVFGLLGPNGAGKSTTLYMMTGLVRPTSGKVMIFGKDLRKHFLEIASRVGVLVERPSFYEHLTVLQNLLLLSRLAGRDVTIDRALDRVGLLHLADRRARNLSQGMRQRLGLAQAFLTEPELLILDEPTTGLDVEHAQEVIALLRRLADESSVSIVLTSHVMHDVETLCDRVAIVNEGKLIACDRTDALLTYDTNYVDVIVDSPVAAAKRLREEPWVASVELKLGRLCVHLNDATPHHLNAFLISAGYQISSLIPSRRTLREFFLKALNT